MSKGCRYKDAVLSVTNEQVRESKRDQAEVWFGSSDAQYKVDLWREIDGVVCMGVNTSWAEAPVHSCGASVSCPSQRAAARVQILDALHSPVWTRCYRAKVSGWESLRNRQILWAALQCGLFVCSVKKWKSVCHYILYILCIISCHYILLNCLFINWWIKKLVDIGC